jgi:hypothetical protein
MKTVITGLLSGCLFLAAGGETLRLGEGGLLLLDAKEFRVEAEGSTPAWDVATRQVAPGIHHVVWTVRVPESARVQEIAARFRFLPDMPEAWWAARRDFHWIPNIKAAPHQIAADHVFRSPAVLTMSGSAGVAVIPDLDVLRESRPAPQFLDLRYEENEAPLIEYGLTPSQPEGHVYYKRSGESFQVPGGIVRFACYAICRRNTTPESLLRETTAFIWSRFAPRYTAAIDPQTVPFRKYAEYGFEMALKRLWVDGPEPGTGGITLSTYLDKQTGEYGGRGFPRDLWFHSWFNNMRTAWGLHYWGRLMNRPEWVERSRAVARLLLMAPREQGLFATIYRPHDRTWQSSGQGGGPEVYHLPGQCVDRVVAGTLPPGMRAGARRSGVAGGVR